MDKRHQNVTYGFASAGRADHRGAGALTEEHVIRVQQLRQKAELLRRVASIPTHGDGLIDRDLLVLAHQLEEEANVREEYLKTHSMPEDGSLIV